MSRTPEQDALREDALRFVLNDLEPEEAPVFERRLADSPDLGDEVRRLRATLDLLPHAARTAPPPDLRARVLRAGERSRVKHVVQPRRSRIGLGTLAAIAAALVAVVLGIDGLRLRRELSLQREVTAMLQEPNVVRSFALAGAGSAGGAYGTVVLDLDDRKGAAVLRSLPVLPADQVYRLWALVDRDNVPCGDFHADTDGRVTTQFAVPVDSYKAPIAKLFVTVERADAVGGPSGAAVMESL
jgi:anti-sigma-K factor RskA